MKSEALKEVLGWLHVALDCDGGETQPGPQIEVKALKKSQSPFFYWLQWISWYDFSEWTEENGPSVTVWLVLERLFEIGQMRQI